MYFELEKKSQAVRSFTSDHLVPTPHVHSHIELILLYSGQSVGIADHAKTELHAGDLFIAFPNQIHYYLDEDQPMENLVVILSPDICPEFKDIFTNYIPETPLLKNALQNNQIVTALQQIHQASQTDGEYHETLIRGYSLILLSTLFKSINLKKNTAIHMDLAKNIIGYCYENYDSTISLQSIADALHISRYHISHLFSKRLHISFSDYINHLRIRKACELLKSKEQSITEIAFAVGYNSPRTFNRCFLNIHGVTPKEYRQLKRKSD
ncbi:MAG: AraC family transcriptional regulator [Clostridia bacterium]|nr:AraC family transcriptional regulator [Clostridia bacterium]